MDLEIDGLNEPGIVDELDNSESADRRSRLLVELDDGLTPSIASNVKYQHDFMETAQNHPMTSRGHVGS